MSTTLRTTLIAIAAAVLTLAAPGAASAHVSVSASSTTAGTGSVLTFRVPVESDTASTVGLTVTLPAEAAFASVQAEPVPGWTVRLTRKPVAVTAAEEHTGAGADEHTGAGADGHEHGEATSAVTEVTWTATAGGLHPGEFGRFAVAVSPLPSTGTLYFPAVQRYSDGTQVDWVQQAQGSARADRPAPSVEITAAQPPVGEPNGDSGWSGGVGVAALVVAAVALALAGWAAVRSRRVSG